MTLLAAETLSGFFEEVVSDAIRTRRVEVTRGATTYLVSLLSDFAHPDALADEMMDAPLAFALDAALNTPAPAERFEKLRVLGDGVLYTCGFFADHFEARGVEQSYLIGIGSRAYDTAGSMLRSGSVEPTGPGDLFRELAIKFGTLVEVLGEVADGTIAKGAASSKALLKVYERWLKTGSERLAQELTAKGLVPTRGGKGVVQ